MSYKQNDLDAGRPVVFFDKVYVWARDSKRRLYLVASGRRAKK